MRSTVELKNLVDRQLRTFAKRQGITLKEALNQIIAIGLNTVSKTEATRKRSFKVRARACGLKAGIDLGHLNTVADELEDEVTTKELG